MYMIKQITPKARELKGTQTKLRYFKSLGSLNQLKHIMIRNRVGKVTTEQDSAFGFCFMWCFIFCFSLHTGCGHDNPEDKIPTK